MSTTGRTQTRSRSFLTRGEYSLQTLENLLEVLVGLDVVDPEDPFWMMLDIRLETRY